MQIPDAPLTVREVVKGLGGHDAVSKLFDVSIPAVSNWIAADRFPDRLHLRVLRACAEKGIGYDPSKPERASA
jgi:hypothetical protein